ncbi:helicase, partial [Sinorhizobium meliloti]
GGRQGEQRRGGQRHGQTEGREGGRRQAPHGKSQGKSQGKPWEGKPQEGKGSEGRPGGQRKDRGDRHDRNKSSPPKFEGRPPRKEKPIDPDSPFAKLAALKEQMKK